jgi:hypothetical protein
MFRAKYGFCQSAADLGSSWRFQGTFGIFYRKTKERSQA